MHLLLLDSASLYWRAYHSLPDSLVNSSGEPINAVRGFFDTVARIMQERRPDRVIACWDEDWRPQWRVDLVPSYKTHRVDEGITVADDEEVVPDTLGPQIPMIAELAPLVGIEVIGAKNCEADDVIASVALRNANDSIDIVSGDRDLLQLVSDRITMLYTGGTSKSRGGKPWLELDPQAVIERFSVRPASYALMATLRGDPSDGLPGVRGIGAKTAVALVNAYPDIDALLSAARAAPTTAVTARIGQAIVEHEDVIKAAYRITALGDRVEVGELPERAGTQPSTARELGDRIGVGRSVERVLKAWGE